MESTSLPSARALSARRPRPFSRGARSKREGIKLPSEPTLDRYFAENAQTQFIQTYKKILHHADIIRGGRRELKSFVKSGQSASIFKETREKLKALGAITPRNQRISSSRRQQNRRFPQLPPLQIDGASSRSPSAGIRRDDSVDSDDSDYDADGYNPDSPRAIFLAGCVRQRIPPRSVAMLRKRLSPKLNLAHMSIGNEIAVLLSEALEKMPYLQILNISDNNLNDIGLSAIIHSAARHGALEELDISLNVIDDKAAEALATYIGNENCPLKCLRMSGAGIDDKECARFVEVLMRNRCLLELDMSKNLLGKDENLNVVKPDFVTGGEILADLLRDSNCPLHTLNLHWNMIRLEGAEVLCDALRSNTYLTNLDLSYNALGTHAACILGSALLENDTLKVLNLANNGIDCIGALTMSVGMRENTSLRRVNLDGNPIGEQGARALMKAIAQEGHRLIISTLNCDIVTKSSSVKLRLDDPIGDYLLCMNHPYDRAIAYEILDIMANDANFEIATCDLFVAGGDSSNGAPSSRSQAVVGKEGGLLDHLRFGTEHLGPLVSSFAVDRFDENKGTDRVFDAEEREKEFLDVLAGLGSLDHHSVEAAATRYDFSGTHVIEVDSLSSLIHELLMHDHIDEGQSRYKKIRRTLSALATGGDPGAGGDVGGDAGGAINSTMNADEEFGPRDAATAQEEAGTPQQVFISQPTEAELAEMTEMATLGIVNDDSTGGSFTTRPNSSLPRSGGTQSPGKPLTAPTVEPPSEEAFALETHPDTIAMDTLLQSLVHDCRRILDARGAGVIDINLFVEYIFQRARVAKIRSFQVQHLSRCLVRPKGTTTAATETTSLLPSPTEKTFSPSSRPQTGSATRQGGAVRFIPPAHGWMHLHLIEAFHFGNQRKATDEVADASSAASSSGKATTSNASSSSNQKKKQPASKTVSEEFLMDHPSGYTMSRARCMRLIEDMKQIVKAQPLTLLQYVLDSVWLRLEEAQLLYSFARNRADDPIAILTTILLRMTNAFEAKRMVQFAIADDVSKLRRVKQRLGSSFYPLIGVFTGHYQLDLSNPVDRKCLKSLIEKSSSDTEHRRLHGLNDTSQHGHWSCFRNEYFRPGVNLAAAQRNAAKKTAAAAAAGADDKKNAASAATGAAAAASTATADGGSDTGLGGGIGDFGAASLTRSDGTSPSVVIIPRLFCPLPTRGLLEFDFVNIRRPNLLTSRPVQDALITDCLLLSRLVENDDVEWALDYLHQLRRANRRSMFPSGKPTYRVGMGRAERVAEHLTLLYSTLFQRQETRKLSHAREGLANMQKKPAAGGIAANGGGGGEKKSDDRASSSHQRTGGGGAGGGGGGGGTTMRKMFAVARAAVEAADAAAAADGTDGSPDDRTGGGGGGGGGATAKAKRSKLQFRNFGRQGSRAKHKLNMWEMRMVDVVYSSRGSDECKASVLLEFFEVELSTYWLECRQVALLLDVFVPFGLASRSNFGSYRVELLILVFDRLVDLHNFDLIWAVLNAEEHAAVLARLGVLNLFNAGKCEGGWSLNLSRWEEVQAVKMLVHLSVAEPGQNWLNQIFALYRGSAPVPSWELNRAWFNDDGLPKKGQISFEMYAGDGLRLSNCTVNPLLRQMLSSLTLVSQRNYVAEVEYFSADPAFQISTTASFQLSVQAMAKAHGGRLAMDEDNVGHGDGDEAVELRRQRAALARSSFLRQSMGGSGNGSGDVADAIAGAMSLFGVDEALFSRERIARSAECRLMQGLAQYQRLALYALSHGTGTLDEVLRHYRQVEQYQDYLRHEHARQPLMHGVATNHLVDDHYHDVAHYTVQDVHDHLERSTDIKWTYATSRKPEVWI